MVFTQSVDDAVRFVPILIGAIFYHHLLLSLPLYLFLSLSLYLSIYLSIIFPQFAIRVVRNVTTHHLRHSEEQQRNQSLYKISTTTNTLEHND